MFFCMMVCYGCCYPCYKVFKVLKLQERVFSSTMFIQMGAFLPEVKVTIICLLFKMLFSNHYSFKIMNTWAGILMTKSNEQSKRFIGHCCIKKCMLCLFLRKCFFYQRFLNSCNQLGQLWFVLHPERVV